MSLIFDIKVFDPKKDAFEHFGFSVFEVLGDLDIDNDNTSLELFVKSGMYSMPIYKGEPPLDFVDELKLSEKPYHVVKSYFESKKIVKIPKASIIFKVVDSQRELHFGATID